MVVLYNVTYELDYAMIIDISAQTNIIIAWFRIIIPSAVQSSYRKVKSRVHGVGYIASRLLQTPIIIHRTLV